MLIEGFTKNMVISYYEVKRCLEFRNTFSDLYVKHNRQLVGTPYQLVYEKLADFEYALTSGALDDETSPEYFKCVEKVRDMKRAIDEVLKSSYTLSSKFHTLYNLMLVVHEITNKI